MWVVLSPERNLVVPDAGHPIGYVESADECLQPQFAPHFSYISLLYFWDFRHTLRQSFPYSRGGLTPVDP